MSIWIHSWSWMSIRHIHNKNAFAPKTNHNLPTWMAFADLFKAFDTYNHALLVAILGKYGTPPRLFSSIKRMYNNIIVKIIIGNIETPICFKVGIK